MEIESGLNALLSQLKEDGKRELEQAEEQARKVRIRLLAPYRAKTRRLEKKIRQEAEREVQRKIQQIKAKTWQEIQAEELALENRLFTEIKESVSKLIITKVGTPLYKQWLEKRIKEAEEVLTSLSATIWVCERDLEQLKTTIPENWKIKPTESIKGGFRLQSASNRLVLDFSLKSMLDEFSPTIEKTLAKLLQD